MSFCVWGLIQRAQCTFDTFKLVAGMGIEKSIYATARAWPILLFYSVVFTYITY